MAVERGQGQSVEPAEDAVRKIQRLRKALGRQKAWLAEQKPQAAAESSAQMLVELSAWEDQLEEIRCDIAELLVERDRLRISHDKLRERIDRHTLEPRSEPDRRHSGRQPAVMARPLPTESQQDFTAIDKELERLNASMLAALNSSSSSSSSSSSG